MTEPDLSSPDELPNPTDPVTELLRLVLGANQLLEHATRDLSKKGGVALLAIARMGRRDGEERYLEQNQIIEIFRQWFALTRPTARKEWSNTKARLFDRDLIVVRRSAKRFYLTAKGREQAAELENQAQQQIQRLLEPLSALERDVLGAARRKIITNLQIPTFGVKKPPSSETGKGRKKESGS